VDPPHLHSSKVQCCLFGLRVLGVSLISRRTGAHLTPSADVVAIHNYKLGPNCEFFVALTAVRISFVALSLMYGAAGFVISLIVRGKDTPGWSKASGRRDAGPDHPTGSRKSSLGQASYPRRTQEAGFRGVIHDEYASIAFCWGTMRRERPDWLLIVNEKHALKVCEEFVDYYNAERPHYRLGLAIPIPNDVV
jgi:hypothetical protein